MRSTVNNLLGSYFSFGHLPLGLGNFSNSRPVGDTFISASRARCRPGGGVGGGGRGSFIGVD